MASFTRNELKVALDGLKIIKEKGPGNTAYGICYNITRGPTDGYEVVGQYAVGWNEHSGDIGNPVPSFDRDLDHWGMYDEAQHSGNLWSKDTEYGRARWRLVDHLIERITADLQQMTAGELKV